MFGFFKRKESFNTPEEKLLYYFKTELNKEAIRNFKKSPMKGTPLEGIAILQGLNNAQKFFKNRTSEIASQFRIDKDKVEDILTQAFRYVHDDLIKS